MNKLLVIIIALLIAGFAFMMLNQHSPTTSKSSHTSGELARTEAGHKISDLDGQSTKLDDRTVAHPGEGRTIVGMDGLRVNEDR